MGEGQRAHHLIEDARLKFGREPMGIGPSDIEVDFGSMAFRTDSMAGPGDAEVRKEIERVQAHIQRVRGEVESALALLS